MEKQSKPRIFKRSDSPNYYCRLPGQKTAHSIAVGGDQLDCGEGGCSPESLWKWIRQAERDSGKRQEVTTDERARMKDLEREGRELRRDAFFMEEIQRVWDDNQKVYGVREVFVVARAAL